MSAGDLLRRAHLFDDLRDDEITMLAGCLSKRVFARKMILYHKGSPAQCLYIIESGAIRIFALSHSGQDITLNIYGPGECFGESTLLDGNLRSTGAMALERTVVYGLWRDDFIRCLELHTQVARRAMALLAHRLDDVTAYCEHLAFLDVPERLAAILLQLAERWGAEGSCVEIRLRLTQSDLASWCACSREMVNKALHVYEDQGLIRLHGHAIVITDVARLRRMTVC